MAGSLHVHLKLSQYCLLISYTPMQNKKIFKKKEKEAVKEDTLEEETSKFLGGGVGGAAETGQLRG